VRSRFGIETDLPDSPDALDGRPERVVVDPTAAPIGEAEESGLRVIVSFLQRRRQCADSRT
jgi:hypothetical protein